MLMIMMIIRMIQMGSALMVSLQIYCFFTEGLLGTPINLLVYFRKCQGVPYSPICQNALLFAAAPFVLTPCCPQPNNYALLITVY